MSEPALAVLPVRLVSFAALATYCGLHWSVIVEPYPQGRMLAGVAIAAFGGWLLATTARLDGRLALGARAGIAFLLLLAALSISGIPLKWLYGPRAWDELGASIGDGLDALPGIGIPYRGADPWPGILIVAGGTLLLVIAAAITFWPRPDGLGHPLLAAVYLGVLFAVPVTQRTLDDQFARGAGFAVLLLAFLALEHVQARRLTAGLAMTAVLAVTGLLLAPRVDGDRAWVDYKSISNSLVGQSVTFNWNHRYGALDYSRQGLTMIRVKARRPAYWKAQNLDVFDGLTWAASDGPLHARPDEQVASDAEVPLGAIEAHPEWVQNISVTLRSLRSWQIIGAGTTLAIDRLPSNRIGLGPSPGTFMARRRSLRRGDSYTARVYSPRPTAAQLRAEGTDYPRYLAPYVVVRMPDADAGLQTRGVPDSRADIAFSAWQAGGNGAFFTEDFTEADLFMASSAYARTWALSRQLLEGAETPYAYAQAIQAHLRRGFEYNENPRRAAVPLEDFLARGNEGFCQQFSGAMALLLRMGGVPARVSSGFTSGTYDEERKEWTVHDSEAHSWVEAYFPSYGWVAFDPTPPVAPARDGAAFDPAGLGPIPGGRAGLGERALGDDVPVAAAEEEDVGSGRGWLALIAVSVLALAALAALLVRYRRRRPTRGDFGDPWLAELERALRRIGRPLAPATTLNELEGRLGSGAKAYIRAVRAARFGRGSAGPTTADRAALRRELARGLGAAGKLRALWALPPRRTS